MADFNQRLKQLRKSRGWSQDVLADKLEITRSCIGNYEQGKRTPDYELLEKIADLFNVDMNYLLGTQQEEHKRSALDLFAGMGAYPIDHLVDSGDNHFLIEVMSAYMKASPKDKKAINTILEISEQDNNSLN